MEKEKTNIVFKVSDCIPMVVLTQSLSNDDEHVHEHVHETVQSCSSSKSSSTNTLQVPDTSYQFDDHRRRHVVAHVQLTFVYILKISAVCLQFCSKLNMGHVFG